MPKKSPSAPTPEAEREAKIKLIRAFSEAVSWETRFGIKPDARADLDNRWSRVVDAIKALNG